MSVEAPARSSCGVCGGPGRHLKTRSRRRQDGLRAVLVACVSCGKNAGVVWTELRGSAQPNHGRVNCACVVGGPEGPCEVHADRSAP